MLTLTENASTIVNQITNQPSQPGEPDVAGLRITTAGEAELSIAGAEAPQPEDKVLEQDGATLYLDENSAAMLDDKILDAAVDEQGGVEFALAIQD